MHLVRRLRACFAALASAIILQLPAHAQIQGMTQGAGAQACGPAGVVSGDVLYWFQQFELLPEVDRRAHL